MKMNSSGRKILLGFLGAAVVSIAGLTVSAQEEARTIAPKSSTLAAVNKNISPADLKTLFFVEREYRALKDAQNTKGAVRPVSDAEVRPTESVDLASIPKPPPEQRELRLGGILFTSKNDWVIWLNDKRVTPNAIPSEVLDLRVHQSYIEVKWLDEWSGQIFPIRLKPHQRFNFDSRIFLPG